MIPGLGYVGCEASFCLKEAGHLLSTGTCRQRAEEATEQAVERGDAHNMNRV